MAIKFQYNKTSLGDLGKQLKMRQKALPTIKSKESALRSEVKKAKEAAQEFRSQLSRLEAEYDYMVSLWGEFDCDLLRIADIELTEQKIAGVRTPVLREIVYEEKPYDLFSSPVWYAAGIDLLKRLSKLGIEYELFNRKMELLDFARRKTTQKVNLYEKVQIPGYEDAMRSVRASGKPHWRRTPTTSRSSAAAREACGPSFQKAWAKPCGGVCPMSA